MLSRNDANQHRYHSTLSVAVTLIPVRHTSLSTLLDRTAPDEQQELNERMAPLHPERDC
jgi:hypothetical protein